MHCHSFGRVNKIQNLANFANNRAKEMELGLRHGEDDGKHTSVDLV